MSSLTKARKQTPKSQIQVGKGRRFSQSERRKAVAVFIQTGRASDAAESIGCAGRTIHEWQGKAWWDCEVERMLKEADAEVTASLTRLVRTSYDAANERLENGDTKFHPKTGEQVRVPVPFRDAALAGSLALDKLTVRQGKPTSISASVDALDGLRREFEKIADAHKGRVVSEQ